MTLPSYFDGVTKAIPAPTRAVTPDDVAYIRDNASPHTGTDEIARHLGLTEEQVDRIVWPRTSMFFI